MSRAAIRIFSKFAELLDVTWGSIADGQYLRRSGTNIIGATGVGLGRNVLAGLTVSLGTDVVNDINIAVGECRDDTNVVDIVLGTALTKQLDAAWAAGTNAGGRVDGVLADGSWHCYVIMKADRTTDFLFTNIFGNPTMPSGYVYKRRIASIVRAGGSIRGFQQLGDYFQILAPIDNHSGATVAQNGTFLLVLSTSVPTGLKFFTDVSITCSHNTSNSISYIYDPDTTMPGRGPLYTPAANVGNTMRAGMWTNTSGTLRVTAGTQTGTFTYIGSVNGYWDPRDKDR